jgi:hypothetical protein
MGEQRAVTERPRPILGATLEPGDDPILGDDLGCHAGNVSRALYRTRAVLRASSIWVSLQLAAQRGGRHRRQVIACLRRHSQRCT